MYDVCPNCGFDLEEDYEEEEVKPFDRAAWLRGIRSMPYPLRVKMWRFRKDINDAISFGMRRTERPQKTLGLMAYINAE